MKEKTSINTQKAFTLVEVAVVLLIGGLILGFVTSSLLSYIRNTQIRATETKLGQIDEAIQLFVSLNGRLPCAAGFGDAPDTADFGIEIDDTNCPGAAVTAGETFQDAGVRIGSVPVRTLNLPDDYMIDSWGNRFTYAVTEPLATTAGYDPTAGAISVVDSTGVNSVVQPPGSAQYLVISHGPNGSGAFVLGGNETRCPPGNLETENCNDDATFLSTLLLATTNNANLYDDLIKIRTNTVGIIPSGAVMAFDLPGGCPDGWTDFVQGQGRAVVGVDGVNFNYNDTGGDDEFIMGLDELGLNQISIQPGTNPAVSVAEMTGRLPHENMPPYISLFYCRKS